MKLPIDVVPGTNPPGFEWSQTVDTPAGAVTQYCHGVLPPSCEQAVVALIKIAKDALRDCAMLRGQVEAANRRAEQQDREAKERVAAAATLKPQVQGGKK